MSVGHGQADPGRAEATRRLVVAGRDNVALQRLAEFAARTLGAPSAQVALIDEVQTVAAGTGGALAGIGQVTPLAETLCTVTAQSGKPLVVRDARADPRVAELLPVRSGDVGAYVGVPLTTVDGAVLGALCVYDDHPRTWSDTDVVLLAQLAVAAVAEIELESLSSAFDASRARWELAIDAAGIGGFDWDLVTGRLVWDSRLIDLFGYDEDSFDHSIEAFNARLHPDDLPRVSQALREAIASVGTFSAEYRVIRSEGDIRWVQARGRALGGEDGTAVRLLGAAYDTTASVMGEARITRVLESMSAAFYSLDRSWRFTYVNAEAERMLERPREELLGGEIWDLFPAAVGSDFELHYRASLATGEPATFEAYYPAPLDGWFELRAWPGPDGLSVYFLDVTERRAAAQAIERGAARAALLADVTGDLASTLDTDEAVARLARLVVPALADWCVVTLVEDDGPGPDWRRARDVGWWHADPDLRPVLERYAALRVGALQESSLPAQVLRTGVPAVVGADDGVTVADLLEPGEAADLLALLAPVSGAVLPLRAHGRTLGLLSVFNGAGSAHPGEGDLDTAVEVAARAGLALDNARLYAQQRRLAEGLQRSLLTEPPEPDHMQVVVRYEPAAEAAQVGGDWYDAFLQPDGATVLVIGDVVGHDTQAAAAMGQVRGLLRGIAATTGDGPAEVLSRLDAAMELLQVGTTATVVVARVEQTPDEAERGITRVRWSNAGHPPPMAINPDGSVIVLAGLAGIDADLLLGIDPDTVRTESQVTLDRGSTVLLYTDGLVERRGQSLDEGLAKLVTTLTELGHRELEQLCDLVLAHMLPAQSEDDVALTAVRLHRQDRPRPPEAGPQRVPDSVDPPLR